MYYLGSSYHFSDVRQVERIQIKLFRCTLVVLKIHCPSHDYSPVTNLFGLSSMAERRRTAGIRFMESLLNGKVEPTDLVSLICFKVPQGFARSTALFYVGRATHKLFS